MIENIILKLELKKCVNTKINNNIHNVRVLRPDQDKQANENKICIVELNQNQKARNIQQRSRRFMNLDLQNARKRDFEDLMNLQNLEDSTNLQNSEI